MLTVALTGGIACGKSTVAQLLRDLGAPVVDADAISHAQTAENGPALPALREAFGDAVFHEDGTLNRAELGRLVFADREALTRLNAVTHPLIRREMERQREAGRKAGVPVVILDIPLLFEAGMQDMADVVVCVSAREETQIRRIGNRDGLSREQALARIRSQMPLAQKEALSDVVIVNDGAFPQVREQVETLYQGWCEAARKENA